MKYVNRTIIIQFKKIEIEIKSSFVMTQSLVIFNLFEGSGYFTANLLITAAI